MLSTLAITVWTSLVLALGVATSQDFDDLDVAARAVPLAHVPVFNLTHSAYANALMMEPAPPQLRQPSRPDSSSSTSMQQGDSGPTRIRGRSINGIIKLAILAGVVMLGIGGCIIYKFHGSPTTQ